MTEQIAKMFHEKFVILTTLSPELVQIDVMEEAVNFAVRLVVEEYVVRHPKVVKHPATWWDAVKERFFPNWLLTRYPARYVEYDANVMMNTDQIAYYREAEVRTRMESEHENDIQRDGE